MSNAVVARHPESPERLAHSVPEAADLIGLGRTLTFELVGRGVIESFKVGRRRLIPHEALVAFVASRGAGSRVSA